MTQQGQTNKSATNKMAKAFTWLAWIFILAILVYGFNDFLGKQWNPNQEHNSKVSKHGLVTVTLQQNNYGHYVTNGEINQHPVTFLLDTGATQVSIPERIAKQLGLTPQGSYLVQTANGSVKVYQTQLAQLRIGEIILYNVAAHINPAMQADEILLGMSALKQIEFRQKGKQLTLVQ